MTKFRPPLDNKITEIKHSPFVAKLIEEGKIPPCKRYKSGLTYVTVFAPFDNGKLRRGLSIDMFRKDRFLTREEILKFSAPFMEADNPNKFTVESKKDKDMFRTVIEEQLPPKEENAEEVSSHSL